MEIDGLIAFPVYSGRDNVVRLVLFDRGEPLDLTPVTRVTLDLNGTLIDSDTAGPGVIWWTDTQAYRGQTVTVLALQLGDQGIPAGSYGDADDDLGPVELVVYDATYINGLRVENPVAVTVHA